MKKPKAKDPARGMVRYERGEAEPTIEVRTKTGWKLVAGCYDPMGSAKAVRAAIRSAVERDRKERP